VNEGKEKKKIGMILQKKKKRRKEGEYRNVKENNNEILVSNFNDSTAVVVIFNVDDSILNEETNYVHEDDIEQSENKKLERVVLSKGRPSAMFFEMGQQKGNFFHDKVHSFDYACNQDRSPDT
jgi:hypothetical protein